MRDEILLEMKDINKRFPGVRALKNVSLILHKGEILGLVGENGAGKSTLIKILGGALQKDGGEIRIQGEEVNIVNPSIAQSLGIGIIFQELSLVPTMSIAENILLGREPCTWWGSVNTYEMQEIGWRLMERLDASLDVKRFVGEFGMAIQQTIEIAKVLSQEVRILVMDEPTSSLSEAEVEKLFTIMEGLKKQGVGIIYISHKLDEIYHIADRIIVLRDGLRIGEAKVSELPPERMIQWMVGRKIDRFFPKHTSQPGRELLRVEHMRMKDKENPKRRIIDDVSFTLRKGEILGLAGLRGAGCSELLGCIFGRFGREAEGDLFIQGRVTTIHSPMDGIREGMALLTNDRKVSGLVLPMSVLHNMTLSSLCQATRWEWLSSSLEERLARPHLQSLSIRAPSLSMEVENLSGGNQQKVVLAKWLMTKPQIMLLDEPTRGIDVGAKAEIYAMMNQWADEGKGILLITSELPELLAMSDRILVMHRGKITAEFSREEATQERVMAAAMQE